MATRPIYYDGGKGEDPVKLPPEEIYCPDGYELDGSGFCVPVLDPIVVDPVVLVDPPILPIFPPQTCLPGAVWDPLRGMCVTDTTPVDIGPVYVDDPVDTSDPPGVGDPIQTVVPTGTNTNPATTTPGIFDSLYDADGKIFGIEPMYVGIAAVAVVFLLFSGGGKR
jgi:hypothetical protein